MKGFPRQTQGILAAGLMAILTVLVFSSAQVGGPFVRDRPQRQQQIEHMLVG